MNGLGVASSVGAARISLWWFVGATALASLIGIVAVIHGQ